MKFTKTQARKEVAELAKQLPELTAEQIEFCNLHLFRAEHHIYHLKGGNQPWCSYCGATAFELKKNADGTATCPHCGHTFKTHACTKQVFRGEFGYSSIYETIGDWQVIRYVCAVASSRKGEYDMEKGWQMGKVFHYQFEFLRKWINVKNGIVVTERTYTGICANYRNQPYTPADAPWVTKQETFWTSEWFKTFVHPNGRIHKELRRKGLTFKRITDNKLTTTPSELISLVCSKPYAETLLKQRRYLLLSYWVGMHEYRQYGGKMEDTFDKYKDSIRIALKHGFDFKDKFRIRNYFDYLKELDELHRDLRSPHYLVPSDFGKAHEETSRLVRRIHEQKWEQERLEKMRKDAEQLNKRVAPYKELCLQGFGLEIRPLLSVDDYFAEGKAMHHCVSGYYNHTDCIILSARMDGNRVETIELSLSDWSVVQSRGLQNKTTKHHGNILKLMKEGIPTFKKMKKEGERMARMAS